MIFGTCRVREHQAHGLAQLDFQHIKGKREDLKGNTEVTNSRKREVQGAKFGCKQHVMETKIGKYGLD